MGPISRRIYVNGIEVEHNSESAYAALERALIEFDRTLQEIDPILPDIKRDDIRKLRHQVLDNRSDVTRILADMRRDGWDHAKAMTERAWRRQQGGR